MDSRALACLSIGATGFVLGILAAFEGALLGIFSGVAALGTGLIGWVISRQVQDTERQLAMERRQLTELETTVTSQVQARISAEEAVRSLSDELSATQRTEAERTQRIEEQIRDEVKAQGVTSAGKNPITDGETGLYNENYFRAAIEARVACLLYTSDAADD